MLDRLRRRLAGFRAERAAELARTQSRDVREFLDGQRLAQIRARIVDRLLDPVRFRFEIEQRRELRLPACATVVDDELARDRARHLVSVILLDHRERHVDRRGHPGRRPDRPVDDEDLIVLDRHLRITALKVGREAPVRRRAPAVQRAGLRENERASARRRDASRRRQRAPHERGQRRRRDVDLDAGTEHHRIERRVGKRLRLDTDAGRRQHEPALLRQHRHLIRRFAEHDVRELERSDRREAEQIEIREDDETDRMHARAPAMSEIACIYDI